MKATIEDAVRSLRGENHVVQSYNRDGVFWYQVDGDLVSVEQMQDLADRAYSWAELKEQFAACRTKELAGTVCHCPTCGKRFASVEEFDRHVPCEGRTT